LASGAPDILGVAGRALLSAVLAGATDPGVRAAVAKGPLRTKRPHLEPALRGHLQPQHRFVLTEWLAQLDCVDERSTRCTAPIQATCAHDAAETAVVAVLDTIPGRSQTTAPVVVAAIGTDRTRLPSAAALAAWAGLAPGHDESAGRQRSGRTRKGNTWRRTSSSKPRRLPPTPHTRLWPLVIDAALLGVGTSRRWWRSPLRCA
jgi:transposase